MENIENVLIFRIKNVKFSGYHFYMNKNIERGFQICISVPLTTQLQIHRREVLEKEICEKGSH